MLFGEHAVLHNKQAVVAAINHYIKVNLTPRSDNKIKIFSSMFKTQVVTLDKFKIAKPYDYVLTAIKQFLPKIKSGFTLNIDADFPSNLGFGSSAAVTVATLAVLKWWLGQRKSKPMQLYKQAVSVVRLVQGFGSGADVAASVFGGVIAYKVHPLTIKKVGNFLPLVVVYSGSKVTTPKVVAQVERRRKEFPKLFAHLDEAIDGSAKAAVVAIKNKDWRRLGKIMNIHQGLHDALGVNNAALAKLIFSLRECPKIYGAKISGSGLGDCVIGLGSVGRSPFINQIDVAVSSSGISYASSCNHAKALVVARLLNQGLGIEQTASITGLSTQEIEKIKMN